MSRIYIAATASEVQSNGGGRLDGVLTMNRGTFENLSSRAEWQADMAGTVPQVACRERERERE